MAPAKNKNRSDTPPESRGKSKTPVALLVATTGLFAYWNLFHSFIVVFPQPISPSSPLQADPWTAFLTAL